MPVEVRRSKLKFTPKANRVIARYFDPGDDERKKTEIWDQILKYEIFTKN
jgi:hypothetical protein